MISFVIDPQDDGTCYGKYERSETNIPDNWTDIVEVNDLDQYEVVSWRYEDF